MKSHKWRLVVSFIHYLFKFRSFCKAKWLYDYDKAEYEQSVKN